MSDKSSSLPLPYYPDSTTEDTTKLYGLPSRSPTQLETIIRSLRLNVLEASNVMKDFIDTGKSHSQGKGRHPKKKTGYFMTSCKKVGR